MKRKLLAVLMSAVCIAASAVPSSVVFADGEKVVTLGADLSDAQRDAILRYFGVAGQNLQTLTITNQDERNHLGSYVPLEQIGTRTYSCALVNPTASGGIQVKTANLTWVTSNMIASTLSTSGVVNCEVLAAAPFEVSGTGALTGILMAYESASGKPLDAAKKDVATQELVTTTKVANNIGQVQATNIVNETKIQVIQGHVIDDERIMEIVEDVAQEQNVSLTDEDRDMIEDLLEKIADQQYDYEEMKDTLERVEDNLEALTSQNSEVQIEGSGTINTTPEEPVNPETEQTEPETLAQDSILMGTDDSALGDSVVLDATNQEAIPEGALTLEAQTPETQAPEQSDGNIVIPPATDVYGIPDDSTNPEDGSAGGTDSEYYIPDGTADVYPPADGEGSETPDNSDSGDGNWFSNLFSSDDGNDNEAPAETQAPPAETAPAENSDSGDGGWFSDLFSSDDGSSSEAPAETQAPPAETAPAENSDSGDGGWFSDLFSSDDGSSSETPVETQAPPADTAPADPGAEQQVPAEAPAASIIPLTDLRFVEVTSNATNFEPLPAGISELTICFASGDYVPGTGTLTVYREYDDSVFDTVSVSSSDRVRVEPISDYDRLSQYGWESGYQMVISLNNPLEANESFYVTFTEDLLASSDGTAHSEALTDTENWCISTLADGLVLDRTSPFLTAGSSVTGHILMDSELGAVSASISEADPAVVSFDITDFSLDAPDFTVTFNGSGTTTLPITYFDVDGNSIYTIDYTITVR